MSLDTQNLKFWKQQYAGLLYIEQKDKIVAMKLEGLVFCSDLPAGDVVWEGVVVDTVVTAVVPVAAVEEDGSYWQT